MKSIQSVFITACILCIIFPASGHVSETRNVPYFTKISVTGGIELIIHQKEENTVTVEAKNENVLKSIITEVNDGTLKIYNKKGSFRYGNRKVTVTMKTIESITASGGTKVKSVSSLQSDILNVKASGGCNITLKVSTNELICKSSGGGNINITGNADSLSVSGSGGSKIDTSELNTNTCEIKSSGGSNIFVHTKKEIDIHSSGGSKVYYSGDPARYNIYVTGGGKAYKK